MSLFREKLRNTRHTKISRDVFRNENGAIDLASIMVGIIVIGLIGGIIAATIFAVIPWSQDNAAKQQLNSISQAENAYMGLSSAVPSPLAAGYTPNSYTDSAGLASANLLQNGPSYCVVTANGGKGFQGFAVSGSGAIWTVTDSSSSPASFTGTLPTACAGITAASSPTAPASASPSASPSATAYTDPTPTVTQMTYNCGSSSASVKMLMYGDLVGTEVWKKSDGTQVASNTYNSPTNTGISGTAITLAANTTYTVTFTGTYINLFHDVQASMPCLRSVDHIGMNSGVTSASMAFMYATNLTSVPAHIPTTITNMTSMFNGASSINDPNISGWDVSNVTNMSSMFNSATAFNQPLNNWNVSKVTDMSNMFTGAAAFNQPLNTWNTASVTTMARMFSNATAFNQPLNTWNTSNVTTTTYMFYSTSYNQPLNNWDVSKVQDMSYMFYADHGLNQDLHTWNTAAVTNGHYFVPSGYNAAYMPPKTSTT